MPEMDLNRRTSARSRRWRRLSRVVSGALGVAAVGGAVYLGATGPLVSPVQPPTAVAAVAPAQPAVDDSDTGATRQGGGRRADHGVGFDAGRRR